MNAIYRACWTIVTICAISGCATSEFAEPLPETTETITVDAVSAWAYASLSEGATVSPTPTAAASSAWDIGFSATNVAINGGSAGPAGVAAYCICQNATANSASLLAMTPGSERAAYDAVTSVPAGATFTSDAFSTQRWYRYNLTGDNRVTPTFDVYLVKRGTTVYKLQVIGYYSATGTARHITFRYERIAQ